MLVELSTYCVSAAVGSRDRAKYSPWLLAVLFNLCKDTPVWRVLVLLLFVHVRTAAERG